MNNEISLIVSEVGEQYKLTKNQSVSKQIENILKQIGISKHDIFLISKDKNKVLSFDNINNVNNDNIFIYSKSNKFEIYSKFLNNILKASSQDNSLDYISSSSIITTQSSKQETKFYHPELYNNVVIAFDMFKRNNSIISANIKTIKKLIDNIELVKSSIEVLNDYYLTQKKNTEQTYLLLDENYKGIYAKITSLNDKYKNFIKYKESLNSFEDISLFEKLFNQSKINLVKEKCIKQFNYITEKIENKAKAYKLTLSKQIPHSENIIENNKLISIQNDFLLLNKKYSSYNKTKFIDDMKEAKTNEEELKELSIEYDNIVKYNTFEEFQLKSEQIIKDIKINIYTEILHKYFDYSISLLDIINSLMILNSKFQSYIKLIKTIEQDVFDIISTLLKISDFRQYNNEYKRRIIFLQNIKASIQRIKTQIDIENEKRSSYNDNISIPEYVRQFFNWGTLKCSFDIFGDEYFKNVKAIEHEEDKKKNNIYNTMIEKLKEKITLRERSLLSLQRDIEAVSSTLDDIKDKENKNINFEQVCLIKKTLFNYYNHIVDIKNKELNNIKRNHISICEIKKGTRNIFIPQSKALYYALLVNYNTNDYLCQYILDLNTLDDNTKELLYNNELIVIGEIDEINSKEDTVYVKLLRIDFILGFNDNKEGSYNNNPVLHNYIYK